LPSISIEKSYSNKSIITEIPTERAARDNAYGDKESIEKA